MLFFNKIPLILTALLVKWLVCSHQTSLNNNSFPIWQIFKFVCTMYIWFNNVYCRFYDMVSEMISDQVDSQIFTSMDEEDILEVE